MGMGTFGRALAQLLGRRRVDRERLFLRFTRARGGAERRGESGPSFGRAAGDFFLTDWLAAAAVAAASEVGGQLRQDGIATARAWLSYQSDKIAIERVLLLRIPTTPSSTPSPPARSPAD
jgi:hypothetical protein